MLYVGAGAVSLPNIPTITMKAFCKYFKLIVVHIQFHGFFRISKVKKLRFQMANDNFVLIEMFRRIFASKRKECSSILIDTIETEISFEGGCHY